MRNGALGLILVVMLIVLNVAKPAHATPLAGGDSHEINSGISEFCGGWCDNHSLISEPWTSVFTLTNDARIFQVNLCVGCATAIQTNIANITQINSIMGGLFDLAMPTGSDSVLEGYVTSLQTNLARIVQLNLCLDCANGDQLNLADIEQLNILDASSHGGTVNGSVPEPGTLLLLSSGIVGLGLWRGLTVRC
jgi:hypothetical protein